MVSACTSSACIGGPQLSHAVGGMLGHVVSHMSPLMSLFFGLFCGGWRLFGESGLGWVGVVEPHPVFSEPSWVRVRLLCAYCAT